MRAILINAEQQKVEEIELPDTHPEFDDAVRQYINTRNAHTFHLNKFTSMVMDTGGHLIETNNAFYSILADGRPIFGNVLCFGWDPLNEGILFDLYHEYDETFFKIRWCDKLTTDRNRKIVDREYQSFVSRTINGHPDLPFAEKN